MPMRGDRRFVGSGPIVLINIKVADGSRVRNLKNIYKNTAMNYIFTLIYETYVVPWPPADRFYR